MVNIENFKASNIINGLLKSKGSVSISSDLISTSIFIFVSVILLLVLVYFIRKLLNIRKSLNEQSILLELTPPFKTEQSSYTTQQLFSLINALGSQRSYFDKFIGKKPRFSLEIVSTQKEGIRYLIRTSMKEVNTLKRSLLSYLPQVSVKTINEYLPQAIENLNNYHFKIVEFKLSKHFAYPLQKQDELEEHDLIAYLTGMMTKLSAGELISLQLALSSTKPKDARKIAKGNIGKF